MTKIRLSKSELEDIKAFSDKFHTDENIIIDVNSTSGIGSVVTVSVYTKVEGEFVTLSKIITDEESW